MKKLIGIIAIVMILITLVFSNIAIADSPSLMDGYITVDNNDNQTSSPAEIKGQTWTASSSYRMSYIEIFMRRTGDPGNIVLNIRTVSDGNPSNTNLVSVELDASSVPVSNSWVRFDLPSTEISDGSVYWWGVYALSGNATSDCYSVRVNKNEGYTGGSMTISPDGGKTWYAFADIGSLFQIYGEALPTSTPTATAEVIPIITIAPTATIQPTETPTPTPTPTVIPAPIAPTSHSNTWLIVLGVIGGLIVIGGGVYYLARQIRGHDNSFGSKTGKNPLSPAPDGGGSSSNVGRGVIVGKEGVAYRNSDPGGRGVIVGKEEVAYRNSDQTSSVNNYGINDDGIKRTAAPDEPLMPETPPSGREVTMHGEPVPGAEIYVELEPESMKLAKPDGSGAGNAGGASAKGKLIDSIAKKAALTKSQAKKAHEKPPIKPIRLEIQSSGEPVKGAEIYIELEEEEP